MKQSIAPTQTQHIDAVLFEDDSARLTITTVSSTVAMVVPNATSLADDLEAVLIPTTEHVVRPTYNVTPTDSGCAVILAHGSFEVPWRFITPVVAQLRA